MTQGSGRISTAPAPGAPGTSGWVGWVAFAGAMLALIGTIHLVEGVVALTEHEYYKVGPSGLLLHLDFTAWGWLHVIGGIVLIFAAVGVFAGQTWARAVGVLVAFLSALAHLAFLAAQPLLSTTVIVICIVVIMALTAHGSEIQAGTPS
jgi:hypothetical protein